MILVILTILTRATARNHLPNQTRLNALVFFSNHREDDTALLMKELERVKKEKELAKQKEVILICWMNDRKKKRRRWRRLSIARR